MTGALCRLFLVALVIGCVMARPDKGKHKGWGKNGGGSSGGSSGSSSSEECECENGGTCARLPDKEYICICAFGFTGETCNVTMDPCENDICGDHGICVAQSPVDPFCYCDPGYGGPFCVLSSSATEESCESDFNCTSTVPSSLCGEDGQCYCPFGSSYLNDTTPLDGTQTNSRICVKDCPFGYELSDQTAEFVSLPERAVISFENAFTVESVANETECRQLCIDNDIGGFPCLTVEYVVDDQRCRLAVVRGSDEGVTVSTAPATPVILTSERACVRQEA